MSVATYPVGTRGKKLLIGGRAIDETDYRVLVSEVGDVYEKRPISDRGLRSCGLTHELFLSEKKLGLPSRRLHRNSAGFLDGWPEGYVCEHGCSLDDESCLFCNEEGWD